MKEEQQQIIVRIKQLIKDMGMNQSAFAERIGVDASNFSKLINGRLAISENLINRIVIAMNVSKPWLLTGEGKMWEQRNDERLHTVTVPSIDSATATGARVYNIDVTAGGMSRDIMFTDEHVIGTINVPNVHKDCYIVRVSGDSMSPVIGNGDLIAIREVNNPNLIFWGQIYVVLLDDYRMVKYIRRHNDSTQVILRSENERYDDIEIAKSEIRHLFLVENIIRIDSRI